MTDLMTWGLAGHHLDASGTPNVGAELARQIRQPDVCRRLGLKPEPEFIIRSQGFYKSDGTTPLRGKDGKTQVLSHELEAVGTVPDVLFVATPTTSDGAEAFGLASYYLEKGAAVVTAEKGSIANHYSRLAELSDGFDRLGFTATVGGGTRMIKVAQEYLTDPHNVQEVHLVTNGTLSFLMSMIGPRGGAAPIGIDEAVRRAIERKYAEPGADSSLDVVRAEAEGDAPKKVGIFFNATRLAGDKVLDWRKTEFKLSNEQVARVIDEATMRRFIISIYPERLYKKLALKRDDIIGGFNISYAGWVIAGGFQNVDRDPILQGLAELTGPGNGAVISLGPGASDGVYTFTGPGAGVGPTANTMLDDWLSIRRKLETKC